MARKPAWVGLGLLLGVAGFACAAPTWIFVDIPMIVGSQESVDVAGSQAAPGVFGAALLVLAASCALALTRARGRIIATIGYGIAAIATLLTTLVFLRDPADGAAAAISDRTGIVGVMPDGAQTHVSMWPIATLGWAVLVVAAAVGVAAAGRGWRDTSRSRTERVTSSSDGPAESLKVDSTLDPIEAWDSLSRGIDPTDA